MNVITVHGIRTPDKDAWYKKFSEMNIWKNTDVKIYNFSYGFFPLKKFIIPKYRKKVFDQFAKFYSDNFSNSTPPSIICHSFGTLILLHTLKKFSVIKFDKVILCGSILSANLDWTPFFQSGQVKSLYNDYGSLDYVVNWSRYVVKGCGNSGEIGFIKVPEKFEPYFIQRKNYLAHGEYFLPVQMGKNWGSLLNPKQFKYKNNILRPEILDRIYTNIGLDFADRQDLKKISAKFSARIDIAGNYYASYSQELINKGSNTVNFFDIRTTADSVIPTDDMDFFAYNDSGRNLSVKVIGDAIQFKIFRVDMGEEIKPNAYFRVNYKFNWKETINCKVGDTDHFAIKGIEDVTIRLNFKFKLTGTRFFYVNEKRIVNETVVKARDESDGTYTYQLEFRNENNYDGVIFYFEGKSDFNSTTMKHQRSYKIKTLRKVRLFLFQ